MTKSKVNIWKNKLFILPLHTQKSNNGTLADRLGNGLQNRVGQFDSARYLNKQKNHNLFMTESIVIFLYSSVCSSGILKTMLLNQSFITPPA